MDDDVGDNKRRVAGGTTNTRVGRVEFVHAAPTAPIPKTTRFGRPELLWVGAVCAAFIYLM